MLTFKQFIVEASHQKNETLKGGVYSSDARGIQHYIKYVAPYLSDEGLKKSSDNILSSGVNISEKMKVKVASLTAGKHQNGTHQTSDGRTVNVSHVVIDPTRIHAITHSGEKISFSKIVKPQIFRTTNKGDKASAVERRIAANINGVSAGFNKHAEADVLAITKRGKFKMESKTTKAKFGQISHRYDPNKKQWTLHGHPLLVSAAKKSTIHGERLLDYMNRMFPDGKVSKGFKAIAAKGSTKAYITANGANALHIHHLNTNTGTTYTVGGKATEHPFHGTGMTHLSDQDIHSLDHHVSIEPNGSVIFRPNQTNLRRLSDGSSDGKGISLDDKKHSSAWLKGL